MAYTTIDDPSAHFQAQTYTGSGAPQDITNTGNSDLQPDMVWTKIRTTSNGVPNISDSSRGVSANNGKWLRTDSTSVESDDANGIRAFNSDGFKTGDGWFNGASSYPYIAWQWKANGGTTSSNTDGNITSTVQANTDAGFSIVTYTGNFTATQTVGHGLGIRPDMVIIKNRDTAVDWVVWTKDLTSGNFLKLNDTNAQSSSSRIYQNGFTTSTFGIGANNAVNKSGDDFIAYCFNSVQGYSKFGKYVGNSNDNGAFVYLGFKPRWLMIKSTQAGMSWDIIDTARSTSNVMDDYLTANTSDPEGTSSTKNIDFLSNGFKCRDDNNINFSDHTYIYMAFAENPFVTSTGVPVPAR